MDQTLFAKRRHALMARMPKDSIALIPAARQKIRNKDTEYPFRQNSDFYYLTSFSEPDALAVLIPRHPDGEYILFNLPKDAASEQWTGPRVGQEGACERFGANKAYPIETLSEHLPTLLTDRECVIYPPGLCHNLDKQLITSIVALERKGRTGMRAPSSILRLAPFLHELRLKKSPEEIELLKKAVKISAKAHIRAMQYCKPGLKEYEIEAEMIRTFLKAGARSPAYATVVGGGKNGCVLHYTQNNAELKSGELLLIDAGAEYESYAGDITRTFPVNGRFTEEQKALYEVVLKAQTNALAKAIQGCNWQEPHEAAVRTITEGLMNLKILHGNIDDLITQEAYKPFYMHRTGHWLGMDVHDVGDYKSQGNWRVLESGMVFTVEPGIYIHPSEHVDSKWWNMGIRIEDDVLIAQDGHEILSQEVPKQIEDIEQVMAG